MHQSKEKSKHKSTSLSPSKLAEDEIERQTVNNLHIKLPFINKYYSPRIFR